MPRIFATIVHHPLSYQLGPFNFTGFGLAILLTFVIAQLISQQEMDILCAVAEPKQVAREPQETARVIRFPDRGRCS